MRTYLQSDALVEALCDNLLLADSLALVDALCDALVLLIRSLVEALIDADVLADSLACWKRVMQTCLPDSRHWLAFATLRTC